MDSLRVSHYRVIGKLGRGGMGEVYLAEDTQLGRKVALKFLPEDAQIDETARRRFVREARSAAGLDHPYICHVYEAGEEKGRPYIAMEYVEGKTLKELLASARPGPEEIVPIAMEVAEALELAHQMGLVHRDLKPANIMLAATGHAKVMDFGLAKQFSCGGETVKDTSIALTEQGAAVGTPAYMSPEQIKGRKLDARSDVFSFGILLYEMLSGIHPFRRGSGMETCAAILEDPPPPLAQHLPEAMQPLVGVVGKMLAKEPGRRYGSMQEIRADLKRVLQDSSAGRGARPRLDPFLRAARRRTFMWAALLLAAVAVGLTWLVFETWFRSPASALAFGERDWILITDFENTTGEVVFDGSLETAMAVSMQQSKYVNIFPKNRVQQVLTRMRLENVQRIDESLAKEIAVREGIKGLLVCGISRIGNQYLLTAQLMDPGSSAAVYSEAERAAGRQHILDALERLARDVREKLGESLASIESHNTPLPQATTSSLAALKAFAQSGRADDTEKRKLLMQAVELDPDFAVAHLDLGLDYFTNSESEKGEQHFRKAVALMDRLTLRERLWIRAVVADWRGERERGIEEYRAYLAQYPDDSNAWFRLGYTCLITNRDAEAVEAFRHVLDLDPRESAAFLNIATAYSKMNRQNDAAANYEKAFAMNPRSLEFPNINHEYGFLLVRMGQAQKAVQVFEKMLSLGEGTSRARGHRSLALLDMYRGMYDAAAEHLDQGIVIYTGADWGLSEIRDRLYLASIFALKQKRTAYDREMSKVARLIEKIRPEPVWLMFTGRLEARCGRVRQSRLMLQPISQTLGDPTAASGVNRSRRSDMAALNLLKGEIELASNRYDEAIEYFQAAEGLIQGFATESLALAYDRKGDLEKAASKYLQLLGEDKLGQEAQEAWILSHYQLGRIYEEMGDGARAGEYYRRFLDIWGRGDKDLPFVGQAREKLGQSSAPGRR